MFFDKDTQFSALLIPVITNSQSAALAFWLNYSDHIKRYRKIRFSRKNVCCKIQNVTFV